MKPEHLYLWKIALHLLGNRVSVTDDSLTKEDQSSGLLQETFSNNKFSFRSISPLNRHWRRKARDRGADAGKRVIES